jgi:hypothetical protein
MAGAQLLQQLEPVHLRHHQIDERDVHPLTLEQRQRRGAVLRWDGLHSARDEHTHHASTKRGLIIYNEHSSGPRLGKAHGGRISRRVCQVDHGFPWTRQRRNEASVKQHGVSRETFLENAPVIFPAASVRRKIRTAPRARDGVSRSSNAMHVQLFPRDVAVSRVHVALRGCDEC